MSKNYRVLYLVSVLSVLLSGGVCAEVHQELVVRIRPGELVVGPEVEDELLARQVLEGVDRRLRVKPSCPVTRSGMSRFEFTDLVRSLQYQLRAVGNNERCSEQTRTHLTHLKEESLVALHPLHLLRYSNAVASYKPEEALAFYLFGLRRMVEDIERRYGALSAETRRGLYLPLLSELTAKYGQAFEFSLLSDQRMAAAAEQAKELYRDWRNSHGCEVYEESLVDTQWVEQFVASQDIALPPGLGERVFPRGVAADGLVGGAMGHFFMYGLDGELFRGASPETLLAKLGLSASEEEDE